LEEMTEIHAGQTKGIIKNQQEISNYNETKKKGK
jgi:hypothetical protein